MRKHGMHRWIVTTEAVAFNLSGSMLISTLGVHGVEGLHSILTSKNEVLQYFDSKQPAVEGKPTTAVVDFEGFEVDCSSVGGFDCSSRLRFDCSSRLREAGAPLWNAPLRQFRSRRTSIERTSPAVPKPAHLSGSSETTSVEIGGTLYL